MPSRIQVRVYDDTQTITLGNHQNVSPYILMDVRAPNPEQIRQYTASPGKTGSKLISVNYNARRIELTMLILGTSESDLRTKVRALRRLIERAPDVAIHDWEPIVFFDWQWVGAADLIKAPIWTADLIPVHFDEGLRQQSRSFQLFGKYLGTYRLTIEAPPLLIGKSVVLPSTLRAYNKFRGPDWRFTELGGAMSAHNFAQKVNGPLWLSNVGTNGYTDMSGAVPVLNDAQYFGDGDTFMAAPDTLMFGVITPITYSSAPGYALEYYNGATWLTVQNPLLKTPANPAGSPIQNNGAAGSLMDAFTTAGEKAISFTVPNPWPTNVVINGATGRWLRIRVTTVGTPTRQPQLQWGPIRFAKSLPKIDASDLNGDAPGRIRLMLYNRSTENIRQMRVGLWPELRRTVHNPVLRHGAEYGVAGAGANLDVTTVPAGNRGSAALRVGTASNDFRVRFDGVNQGYREIPLALTPSGSLDTEFQRLWSVGFFLQMNYDSSAGPGGVSARPQPIFGVWGGTGEKKLLILLENQQLSLWLSRNGSTKINTKDPTQGRKVYLTNPTKIVSDADPSKVPLYYCRITRAGKRIWLYVTTVTPGGNASLTGQPIETTERKRQGVSNQESLGDTNLHNPGLPFRLGWPAGTLVNGESEHGDFTPLNGIVEQLELHRVNPGNSYPNTSGLKPGQLDGNDASNGRIGLYLFNNTPGQLVNSQTSGNVSGSMVASGSGTSMVTGLFDSSAFQALRDSIRLPFDLADGYRGWYHVHAIVNSAAADTRVHSVKATQRGIIFTDNDRQVQAASKWQTLDLGGPIKLPPKNPSAGGRSFLGSGVDRPEEIGVVVRANDPAAPACWVDEFLTFPEAYVFYDCGPDSTRQIPPNGGLMIDTISEPPIIAQFDANGYLQDNADAFIQPYEFTVKPGAVHWLGVDMVRYATGAATSSVMENHPDDYCDVVATLEDRHFNLDT